MWAKIDKSELGKNRETNVHLNVCIQFTIDLSIPFIRETHFANKQMNGCICLAYVITITITITIIIIII